MSGLGINNINELEYSNRKIPVPECRKISRVIIGMWESAPDEILKLMLKFLEAENPYVRIIAITFFRYLLQKDKEFIEKVIDIYKKLSFDENGYVRNNGIVFSLKGIWKFFPEQLANSIKNTGVNENSYYKILALKSLARFLAIKKNDNENLKNLLFEEIDKDLTFNETFFNREMISLIVYCYRRFPKITQQYLEKWAISRDTFAHYILEKALNKGIRRYGYYGRMSKSQEKDLLNKIEETKQSILETQIPLLEHKKYEIRYVERKQPFIIEYFNMGFYPFYWSINPYRGSEYDYVYSNYRFNHKYVINDSNMLIKEINIKINALDALKRDLNLKKWKRYSLNVLHVGSIVDPYQKAEEKYEITKSLLNYLLELNKPVAISTISPRILRDLDLLTQLSERKLLNIMISIPTLNEKFKNSLEINTPSIAERLELIKTLKKNKITVGVRILPIIPYVNDDLEEVKEIMEKISNLDVDFAIVRPINFAFNIKPRFYHFIEENYSKEILKKYDKIYPKETTNGYSRNKYVLKTMKNVNKLLSKYKLDNYKKQLRQ